MEIRTDYFYRAKEGREAIRDSVVQETETSIRKICEGYYPDMEYIAEALNYFTEVENLKNSGIAKHTSYVEEHSPVYKEIKRLKEQVQTLSRINHTTERLKLQWERECRLYLDLTTKGPWYMRLVFKIFHKLNPNFSSLLK